MLRVLVTDSDWQLLKIAFSLAQQEGFELIVEANPREASKLIRAWRPDVVITSAYHMDYWQRKTAEAIDELLETASVLITARADEDPQSWRQWLRYGAEVLFLPIAFMPELFAAIDAAATRPRRSKAAS